MGHFRKNCVTDRQTDGLTNGLTNGLTDNDDYIRLSMTNDQKQNKKII